MTQYFGFRNNTGYSWIYQTRDGQRGLSRERVRVSRLVCQEDKEVNKLSLNYEGKEPGICEEGKTVYWTGKNSKFRVEFRVWESLPRRLVGWTWSGGSSKWEVVEERDTKA